MVEIKGNSESCPIVYANSIRSLNHEDNKKEDSADGYFGIIFEGPETAATDDDFTEGIVYGNGKTVDLSKRTETYTLGAGKKLTVLSDVTFKPSNKFTLDASTLYLNAGAALEHWYEMEKINDGEILHEDESDYKWYGAEKYEFINETNYTELYSLDGSEGIVLCDICGEPEDHDPDTDGNWVQTDTHHWQVGSCKLGEDCSINHNQIASCSYIVEGNKLYYGEHRFGEPTKEDDGLWHYICIDCLYEKTEAEPITPPDPGTKPSSTPSSSKRSGYIWLYKVDSANGSPLEGAEFGLYSDEKCTSLIKSDVSEMDDDKAVVFFKVDAGDTYYIKEISAPSGYRLSGKVFRAEVSSDGTVTYSVVGSSGSSEDIPVCENVKGTGNPGTAAGTGVTGIAVISGMVLAVSLIKRAKNGRKNKDGSNIDF